MNLTRFCAVDGQTGSWVRVLPAPVAVRRQQPAAERNSGEHGVLATVVKKGCPAAAANRLLSIPTFCFFAGKPAYLRDSLLIDMTADEKTQRRVSSTRTDQIGKAFAVVGHDVRRCLVCEQLFTRRASAEHSRGRHGCGQ
jgi:hypothetical protein